ncbi:beta-ketoacyl-[acyl-carrier-protein] synthase family protein [Mucisphaera calidilacus]|uniref:3-oxoacyl-[acyl-carrier-protein] synthase 2 n=1 Tax=Mucisphaera calidilacus TaxID=2527982 RepID=A0A518BTG1_9BACT|nr:beta-ketoacyl-[acyl-carrier-protein] synthase family protein [Mucisphaera calidilacus]QDU70261.1 3-oxoacyl-[acyl-carrier-protein] synthase 2 [Mucisphaera calidilacus]
MADKIVVTGIGWVTPLGHDIERVWQRLIQGDCGIGPIQQFDASTYPTSIAAEVTDFDHNEFVKHPEAHANTGRNVGYALGAATMAWRSAKLDAYDEQGKLDHDRLGIYLGSGEGLIDFDHYVEANLAGWQADASAVDGVKWIEAARRLLTPDGEIEQEPNMPLAHLAMEFDARGPAYNCLTACAASTQAIGEAMHILRHGDADVMITGGAHTMIHPLGVTGFNRLTALSNRNDDPATASRPFSRDRDGFVIGEGSGILILETEEHARARGAEILAEIAGYGSTADAYRITDIHPDGRGAAQAMRLALRNAGVTTDQIDYISAHGTSTKENDVIESKAVKAVFGDRAPDVPISSIKSMLGHLIAAAGSTEAIVCVLALRDQVLPPTINLHNPDPECDLDYVPNEARRTDVNICLSNSFGFGGQNDTLIIRRYAS